MLTSVTFHWLHIPIPQNMLTTAIDRSKHPRRGRFSYDTKLPAPVLKDQKSV